VTDSQAFKGDESLKSRWAAGRQTVNGWCSIPSAVTAEAVGAAGFDTVTVDLQHGLIDYQTALAMFQALDRHGKPLLARVPWNDPGIVMKVLDAGVWGVICPMVNTRVQAEAFAAACRYPPRGIRSFGPTRAALRFGGDYAARADDFVTTIAMIETREAVDNLDAILAVPELDAVYIGPSDLSLSLGCPPTLNPEAPEVLNTIARIRAAAQAAGKAAGIHCGSPERVRRMLGEGFDFASVATDSGLLRDALAAAADDSRPA